MKEKDLSKNAVALLQLTASINVIANVLVANGLLTREEFDLASAESYKNILSMFNITREEDKK